MGRLEKRYYSLEREHDLIYMSHLMDEKFVPFCPDCVCEMALVESDGTHKCPECGFSCPTFDSLSEISLSVTTTSQMLRLLNYH